MPNSPTSHQNVLVPTPPLPGRMLSNRESARRSRRRKHEHVGELEKTLTKLRAEMEQLRRERSLARADCGRLQAEVAALRTEVGLKAGPASHRNIAVCFLWQCTKGAALLRFEL